MEYYATMIERKSIGEIDPITIEEFDNSHPRAVMMIRRSKGIPFPINVKSVLDIITKGNNRDPFTREIYSENVRKRAELYYKAVVEFPRYKLNSGELYKRWLDTFVCDRLALKYGHPVMPEVKKIQERTRLEARCFLQAEDLMDFFKPFFGNSSNMNRKEAEKYLLDSGYEWILRNCSKENTEYDMYYALTALKGLVVNHYLICHKLGEGFFCNDKFFPSIIDCIEYILSC